MPRSFGAKRSNRGAQAGAVEVDASDAWEKDGEVVSGYTDRDTQIAELRAEVEQLKAGTEGLLAETAERGGRVGELEAELEATTITLAELCDAVTDGLRSVGAPKTSWSDVTLERLEQIVGAYHAMADEAVGLKAEIMRRAQLPAGVVARFTVDGCEVETSNDAMEEGWLYRNGVPLLNDDEEFDDIIAIEGQALRDVPPGPVTVEVLVRKAE